MEDLQIFGSCNQETYLWFTIDKPLIPTLIMINKMNDRSWWYNLMVQVVIFWDFQEF